MFYLIVTEKYDATRLLLICRSSVHAGGIFNPIWPRGVWGVEKDFRAQAGVQKRAVKALRLAGLPGSFKGGVV